MIAPLPAAWAGLLLLFARMMGVAVSGPLLSHESVPAPARVGVAVALTVAVAAFARVHVGALGWGDLILGLAWELGIGLLIGFVASFIVYVALVFGGLVDAAAGLSFASSLNPILPGGAALFESFAGMLALVVFAAAGGLNALVMGLAASVEALPVGLVHWTPRGGLALALAFGGGVLGTGALIALPALATVTVTNFAVGLLSRMLPQMNVFAVSLGLGPVVAALAVFLGLGVAVDLLNRVEGQAIGWLLQYLGGLR
jgi:flagellar biosynthetic protein FliR